MLLLAAGAFFAYRAYQKVYGPNLTWPEGQYLFVKTGSTFQTVTDSLRPYLKNEAAFEWVAQKKNYPKQVKPGRYALEDGMSNNALLNKLRSGDQEPLNLVIFGLKNLADLSGFLGKNLEYDSLEYFQAYTSENFLRPFDLQEEEVLGQFLPNTYEFYWNASPKYTLERMQRESGRYWQNHQKQLDQLELTPHEVVTLASIVESETVQPDEMPTVAGLYLNRLERGIKLQSDPTVIYGIRKDKPNSPIIKRVLFKHLRYQSEYNTYLHAGLPPGPIKLPSLTAIEAVLHAEDHNFIFMVADPKRPGYHSFATNLRQHNINRAKYIQWVRTQ